MGMEPFWREGPSKVHEVDNVRFQSTLINPIAETQQADSYPLVIWFCGLGPSGLSGIDVQLAWLSRVSPKPFVLVAPIRPSKTWWVLDDCRPPWGCVIGSLLPNDVASYCRWICTLADTRGIDRSSVSLFGCAAGAYTTSEIIAHGTCALHCVGLAALHGHGRPDLDGLDEECRRRSDEIMGNWSAYISRISEHRTSPNILIGVHNEADTFWPWKYAREIYRAFDDGRHILQRPPTTQVLVKAQNSMFYGPKALELFLQYAVGDAEGTTRWFGSQSFFHPPVSGRPARRAEGDAIMGRERSRSRDAEVMPEAEPRRRGRAGRTTQPNPAPHAAPEVSRHGVPRVRSSVGLDGPPPVDHIGSKTLGSGIQAIYIRHSDRISQELWQNAKSIGANNLPQLDYFDSQVDSPLGDSVRPSFAEDFFICSNVGDLVAVGIGENKVKRTRASRIAAAVCFQLQATSPVREFPCYSELQSLIKQVRPAASLRSVEI